MAGKRQYNRATCWTDEYLLELIEDRQSGRTLQEIGDDLGVTRERVRQLLLEAEIRGLWDGLPLHAKPDAFRTPQAKTVLARAKHGAGSLQEVANDTGVCVTTVGKILGRHEPELRQECRQNYPLECAGADEIRRLYWEEGLSTVQIAKHFNTAQSAVAQFMKRNSIPTRPSNQSTSLLSKAGPQRVRSMYWDDEMSCEGIAQEFGVSSSAVNQFMLRHGIERRSPGGARR